MLSIGSILKFACEVGTFVLLCIVAVLVVGIVAQAFFEDAKKKPTKNDADPRQPLEPQRSSAP